MLGRADTSLLDVSASLHQNQAMNLNATLTKKMCKPGVHRAGGAASYR